MPMPDAPPAIRVLVVDDHALFSESVARLLESDPGFLVVGTCTTVEAALDAVRSTPVDVVLLDFDLGAHDGIEFVTLARRHGFTGRILVVTAGVTRDQAATLIREGVAGIFMKHESAAKLASGIREVAAGQVWLDQRSLQAAVAAAGEPAPTVARLTDRERSVLALVLEGLANKEIADRIGVSESSVKGTLQQLFAKTGVRTRSQLVRVALEDYPDAF